ncbi:hypothetical protein HPB50_011098 [Hyalomma asiaticum]|uniref:Uncharacterized protein n=1 Tax=Hyalomma asiaticum TaxID=266040 RepID=A0ACB7SGQ5_HYAAI|nr:hypothetical protein HPB50_011098 [Hyalomma asiaticum]
MTRTALSSHQTTSAIPSSFGSTSVAASPSTSQWGTVGVTDTRAGSAAFTTDARQPAPATAVTQGGAAARSPETTMRWSHSRTGAEPFVSRVQDSQVTLDVKRLASVAAPWAGSLSVGAAVGYSLPAARSLLRSVDNGTDEFRISDKEIFWFDSLLLLGAVFGSLCGCFVAHWLGRRRLMALGCLGSLASWLAVAAASAGSFHLLTARVLGGLCTGIVSLVVPAYIAEASPAKDRGKTCGAYQTGVAAGVFLMYAIGKFANWTQLALWCAMPPAMALLLLWMAVESPRWLHENAQREEAQKALRILRGTIAEADAEYEEIEAIYAMTPTPLIHYMLAVLVMVVQQFSGVNTILLFASGPLHAGFGYASDDTLLVLSFLQFVTTAIAAQLLDALGRVKPLAVSVVVSTSSVMALGGVYFSVSHGEQALDTHLAARITVVCKVIFSIGFSLGLGPASWTLAVELAPLRKHGFEFGSVCAFHWASALGMISLFTMLGTTTGSLAVLVSLSGVVTFAGGMTAIRLLPDTRGVSLEGILLRGQADVCSRRAQREDQKTTRGEQKKRSRRGSGRHSLSELSSKRSSKPTAKATAKSQTKPPVKVEPKAKVEVKPQPEVKAKAVPMEAVASGEAEAKPGVISGPTSTVTSPAEAAPGKQEMSEADDEG